MEEQPHYLDKLALAVSSCMLAKEALVSEHGLGEDLPITLFGWIDQKLTIIAQLRPEYMKIDPEERLKKISFCATVLRKGWDVGSFTFVAEAFCSSDPEKTRGLPLDWAFVQPDSAVRECITFTHVEKDFCALVMAPYKQALGRKIEWDETVHQKNASGLRDAAYPATLTDVLSLEKHEMPEDADEFYATLAAGLEYEGFDIQFDFS